MKSSVPAFRRCCRIRLCAVRWKTFRPRGGRVLLVAAGKAAWMAHAAVQALGHVDGGVVVTKYGHVKGKIPGISCYEAGHHADEQLCSHRKSLGAGTGATRGYRAVSAFRRRQCPV